MEHGASPARSEALRKSAWNAASRSTLHVGTSCTRARTHSCANMCAFLFQPGVSVSAGRRVFLFQPGVSGTAGRRVFLFQPGVLTGVLWDAVCPSLVGMPAWFTMWSGCSRFANFVCNIPDPAMTCTGVCIHGRHSI
eukprot:365582-Chlamydomonas_euryale.AAC.5